MQSISESEAFEKLKKGSDKEIHVLYGSYRTLFIRFISKTFNCHAGKADEIYPEAFSILYFNIRQGKLTPPLNSTLQTYLNSTGWHLYHRRYLDKYHRDKIPLEIMEGEADSSSMVDSALMQKERAIQIRQLLDKIGDPCKSLLTNIYLFEKSYKELSTQMNIEETTLRKRKYDCLGKIRNLIRIIQTEL